MIQEPFRIEVFQEFELSSKSTSTDKLLKQLDLQAIATSWVRASAIEDRLRARHLTGCDRVIAFERNKDDSPAVELVLWPVEDELNLSNTTGFHYRVSNIVPVDLGSLGVHRYNDALESFQHEVVEPVRKEVDLAISVTDRFQTMTDWTSKEAAIALNQFSGSANMSTGNSHPADKERFWTFVIADHKARGTLTESALRQWLIEADRWPEVMVDDLVADWSNGKELLTAYDQVS